jgi:hypothetical protein
LPLPNSSAVRSISNPGGGIRPGAVNVRSGAEVIVDFLTNALTDCRVEKERAPFDHPSLDVPNGPSLPATGAAGYGACP